MFSTGGTAIPVMSDTAYTAKEPATFAYRSFEMSKTIPLTRGYSAIIDDCDYEKLKDYKWIYNQGYAKRFVSCENIGGKWKIITQIILIWKTKK